MANFPIAVTQLNQTAFAAVWAEGRPTTLEQSIEYALNVRNADGAG
jgi:hypothetical protein